MGDEACRELDEDRRLRRKRVGLAVSGVREGESFGEGVSSRRAASLRPSGTRHDTSPARRERALTAPSRRRNTIALNTLKNQAPTAPTDKPARIRRNQATRWSIDQQCVVVTRSRCTCSCIECDGAEPTVLMFPPPAVQA